MYLILLLLFSLSLFSQHEDSNLKNDLGVNVNVILNKIVLKKVTDEITHPFPDQLSLLTYRHFVSPKLTIRIGLGYDQFSRFDTSSNISGMLIEEDQFRFYALYLGFQKNVIDAKKVKLTLGWDWLLRKETQARTRNDFFFGGGIALEELIYTDTQNEISLGFGIPLGFQYFISDRIFISTEFSLEIFQTFSKTKSEFVGSSGMGYTDNPDTINLKFRPPLGLFLHYRF